MIVKKAEDFGGNGFLISVSQEELNILAAMFGWTICEKSSSDYLSKKTSYFWSQMSPYAEHGKIPTPYTSVGGQLKHNWNNKDSNGNI